MKTTKVHLKQHGIVVKLPQDWLEVLVNSGLRAHVASRHPMEKAFANADAFNSHLVDTLNDLGIKFDLVD